MSKNRFQVALAFVAAISLSRAASAAGFDGIWRSRGYGLLVEIHGGRAAAFDYTAAACTKRPKGPQRLDELIRDPRLSGDGKLLTSLSVEALTIIYFERVDHLPRLCSTGAPNNPKDPLYNFDVFWSYYNDYYAFFSQRAVDWNDVREQYRPRIDSHTSDADLLRTFRDMLRKLQDRHTNVHGETLYVNPATTELFNRWRAEYFRDKALLNDPDDFLLEKTRSYLKPAWNRYLDPDSVRQLSPNIVTGTSGAGRFGYIAVLAEEGAASAKTEVESVASGGAQLDAAFAMLKGRSGLIVDVRINYGGDDGIALAFAGLITDRDRPGFLKCTRDGAGFTPTQQTFVRRRANAFDGPVVVLSSPDNVSSGENFAMMAKTFPNVVLVGDRTASVHSDVLEKRLPNGWAIGISNEAFISSDGTMYETVGVAPDVLVSYYPEMVKETGVDPLLEKALDLLGSARFSEVAAAVKRSPSGRPSPCPP